MTRVSILALAALLAACTSRATMTRTHGESYRAVLQAQTAHPQSKATPPRGLDAQEGTIVAEGYRKSLAPKEGSVKEPPVVVLTPQQMRQQQLAPSVPK